MIKLTHALICFLFLLAAPVSGAELSGAAFADAPQQTEAGVDTQRFPPPDFEGGYAGFCGVLRG